MGNTYKAKRLRQRVTSAHAGRSDVILDSYEVSTHARVRMAQRGLSEADLRYVLRFGRLHYAADAVIYFLCGADIPSADRSEMGRLEGAAAITSFDGTVITVWRNRAHGMKVIRRKLDLVGGYIRCGQID